MVENLLVLVDFMPDSDQASINLASHPFPKFLVNLIRYGKHFY
jgi:hypothetical protein